MFLKGNKAGAEFLGMNERTFKHYVSIGLIPQRKIGKSNVYKKSELESAISEIVNQ